MKTAIYLILASLVAEKSDGVTKEDVIPRVTVRLVRKDWRPEGYDPGTDDPLPAFPGNYTELYKMYQNYHEKFGYVAEPLRSAVNLFDNPHYNASQPSLVITHPLTIGDSLFISHSVLALTLRNLHKHYNIFAMHAPWLSWQFQMSCARVALGLDPQLKPVAEAFASFLLDGIALGKLEPYHISFIGFSYAATLNTYIAREIRNNTGRLAHTLMAVDVFQYGKHNRFFEPTSRVDAMYVHLIHSSSKMGGTEARIGTVDIVLNNGFYQPGCQAAVVNGVVACSHRRSVAVFIFSIIAHGNVVARQCSDWEKFSQCGCSDPSSPLLVVSFPVNEQARGTFYTRTRVEVPYPLGIKGAYCAEEEDHPHNVEELPAVLDLNSDSKRKRETK